MRSEGYTTKGQAINVGIAYLACKVRTDFFRFCRTMGRWRECGDDSDKCEHGGSIWLVPEETLYLVQEDKLRLYTSVDRANQAELPILLVMPWLLAVCSSSYRTTPYA